MWNSGREYCKSSRRRFGFDVITFPNRNVFPIPAVDHSSYAFSYSKGTFLSDAFFSLVLVVVFLFINPPCFVRAPAAT
jgi:hypothetical protein